MTEFKWAPLPPGPFDVIMADPPWAFKSWDGRLGTPHRTAVDHYKTVPLPLLKALPVESVAARDAVLVMWTISSHLDQALELVGAWGFTYRSLGPVWVKTTQAGAPRMGMGQWFRQEAEVSLLATRGRPAKPVDRAIRQVVLAQRGQHSEKPDNVRHRVERLNPDARRLELFARHELPGWTCWGDQVGDLTLRGHRA